MTRIQTQLFYILIFCITTFFGFICQKKKNGEIKFSKKFFFLSFIIPWFVLCFTNIGSDYKNYYEIISGLTWNNFSSHFYEEAGMNVVFLILKSISGGDPDIVIFILKTINICLAYLSFYLVKDKIRIGYSILSYLLLAYLPSFYLLTIFLSAGIVYLAIVLRFYKNKKIVPILLIILAGQFHNSAYIFLPIYLASILLVKEQKNIRKIFITIIYICVIALSSHIYSYFINNVHGFHYINYGGNNFTGSGLMIVILYLPLFIFALRTFEKDKNDIQIPNLIWVFFLSSLLFNILSYKFVVIERMEFYMLPLFSHFIPSYISDTKLGVSKYSGKTIISSTMLFLTVYILFRGYLVFYARTTTAAGVGLYHFFNPFL